MTTEIAQKLDGVRDFRKILETVVKEIGETYAADITQIALSNPLDRNITSICEYKLYPEANADEIPVHKSFPLPIEGAGLGVITLARRTEFHENEINWIRITLAELSDAIRFAQINDVVQRDTFRNTFLSEIQNVMQYSLGIGDALFMVVNILGKVLNASRCLFICVDDEKSAWKCFEFWQRERLQSCQDFGWPTSDSPIVARSLLASSPMSIMEANESARSTPVQEELQLLGVRSLLGVPLKSESATHGCIILHHCEMRHEWTRGEVDMVQYVADTVAEALAKLPEEKKAHEPIMRLHQREVTEKEGSEKESILAIRRALRGALTPTAIPTAGKKTGQKAKPPVTGGSSTPPPAPAAGMPAAATPSFAPPAQPAAATAQPEAVPPPSVPDVSHSTPAAESAPLQQPSAALQQSSIAAQHPSPAPQPPVSDEVSSTLHGLLQSMTGASQQPHAESAGAPSAVPGTGAGAGGDGNGGSPWGNLDAIPTPTSGPARAGLSGSMIGGAKKAAGAAPQSALMASLHKDKSKFQQPVQYVDGGVLQIDEAQAEAKLKQVLATTNPTSDYIFATTGLDPRMLGRIDGWISQIEQKDKYETPHAMQVSEYSVALGRFLGLPESDLHNLRIAGILHDVGKLGLAANVLQKPEEELSDTELILMMKHAIDGAGLVEGFPELSHLAPIILSHHEEFDGNGYPAGQSGEEIPLAARIIHLCSSYHAFTGGTRHKQPLSQGEALQLLRAGAGKTYDPTLVEAFVACVQQGLVGASR